MNDKPDRNAWLKGGNVRCTAQPEKRLHPCRLVLLGAPGVGKGTQAALISERLGACHLSTGDIFRAAKNCCEGECTPAMTSALAYMKRGELVPDRTVLSLVTERAACLRCGGGFLLDGFPRTVVQADTLGEVLDSLHVELDAVLNYEMPLAQIVARLSGRRTCTKCKAVFHIETKPPLVADRCDYCSSALYQREDDRPECIRVRMDAYEKSTAPLVDFYRSRNLLVTISAIGTPEEIFNRSLDALEQRIAKRQAVVLERQ